MTKTGNNLAVEQCTDGAQWAKAFIEQFHGCYVERDALEGDDEVGEDDLRAWFANAIQAGIDHTRNEVDEQPEKLAGKGPVDVRGVAPEDVPNALRGDVKRA